MEGRKEPEWRAHQNQRCRVAGSMRLGGAVEEQAGTTYPVQWWCSGDRGGRRGDVGDGGAPVMEGDVGGIDDGSGKGRGGSAVRWRGDVARGSDGVGGAGDGGSGAAEGRSVVDPAREGGLARVGASGGEERPRWLLARWNQGRERGQGEMRWGSEVELSEGARGGRALRARWSDGRWGLVSAARGRDEWRRDVSEGQGCERWRGTRGRWLVGLVGRVAARSRRE